MKRCVESWKRNGVEWIIENSDGLDTWGEWMSTVWLEGRLLMVDVSGGRVRGRPRLGWMDDV